MTIKELIIELQKYPGDMEVMGILFNNSSVDDLKTVRNEIDWLIKIFKDDY